MEIFDIGRNIVAIGILIGVISLLVFHLRRLGMYKHASKFHGPKLVPFVGNALLFLGNASDLLKKFENISTLYPSSPVRLWLGTEFIVVCFDPEQIKQVLTDAKLVDKSKPYDFIKLCIGNGLVTAPAPIWRMHRKLIRPSLNLKILESFVDIFVAKSKRMLRRMEKEVDGEEFELDNYMSMCAFEIICETVMDLSIDEPSEADRNYIHALERAAEIGYQRLFKPWFYSDKIFYRSALGKEFMQCAKTLHDLSNEAIEKRKETFFNKPHHVAATDPTSDTRSPLSEKKVILDYLIELSLDGNKFSALDARDELNTLLIAGYETTCIGMSNVLFMLANNPDVQEKVHRELIEIYGDDDLDDRDVKYEDLPRMEYLERVIKETLRLFPSIPYISRLITEDLKMGEYTLPKGCLYVAYIYRLHRSEEYWENPLTFNPDRFTPEEIAKRHSHCFIPFNVGPRNCIGIRYAMMEMKTVLATILRKYVMKIDKIVPINEINMKANVLLKPMNPLKIRIKRRVPDQVARHKV